MTNIVEGLEKKPNPKNPVACYSKLLLITENKQGQGNFPLHVNVNFPSSKYMSLKRVLIETENQNFSAGCFKSSCKNTSSSCPQDQV